MGWLFQKTTKIALAGSGFPSIALERLWGVVKYCDFGGAKMWYWRAQSSAATSLAVCSKSLTLPLTLNMTLSLTLLLTMSMTVGLLLGTNTGY